MNFDADALMKTLTELLTQFGLKLLGAIALWFIGRWLISMVQKMLGRTMRVQKLDGTLVRYVHSSVSVLLNVVLVLALLSFFGVQTTSFAALLAAAGVAIGMAWSGLLANFASGVFLIVLRPVKVGDFVEGGGVTGTVVEIGLFVTQIDTPDHVRTFVGNNKLFSDNIKNYSTNPHRRVDRTAQLAHGVDHHRAIALLKERVATIPNVMASPAPDITLLDFNLAGPVLAVRPYCHTDHYWQVYFDTNEVIRQVGGELGLPVPQQHYHVEGLAQQAPTPAAALASAS